MIDGFVMLSYGFCAAMTLYGNRETVEVGYTVQDKCIVQLQIDDPVATAIISGHDIAVVRLDDGAEVAIDNLRFTIQNVDHV
jgi:hypothetical protein